MVREHEGWPGGYKNLLWAKPMLSHDILVDVHGGEVERAGRRPTGLTTGGEPWAVFTFLAPQAREKKRQPPGLTNRLVAIPLSTPGP